jgi:hypothetical protein
MLFAFAVATKSVSLGKFMKTIFCGQCSAIAERRLFPSLLAGVQTFMYLGASIAFRYTS